MHKQTARAHSRRKRFQAAFLKLFPLLLSVVFYRMLRHQTHQRRELEAAHQQLSDYAATLEKLAISQERNRLARELHDTLAHTLSASSVKLNAINVVWDARPEKARSLLTEVIAMLNEGMVEVRRALRDLRTTPLEDLGLLLALRNLAQSAAERGMFQLDLHLPPAFEGLLPQDEQGIYRIVQEALANVVRHAEATLVTVKAEPSREGYHFVIRDNGCGFDVSQTHRQSHFGLNGMLQRALMTGGTFTIDSQPGSGTRVAFSIPCRAVQRMETSQ